MKFLVTFLLVGGFSLAGCAHLKDVDEKLQSRSPSSFLLLSFDPGLHPGVLGYFPLSLSNSGILIDQLRQCDMNPVVLLNPGYQETPLLGSWFSDKIWINFSSETLKRYSSINLINGLSKIGPPVASLKFSNLVLEVLDSNATTYNFINSHITWTVEDFIKHFETCRYQQIPDRYLAHHILRSDIQLRFYNRIGLPLRRDRQKSELMLALGFKPGEGEYDYSSIRQISVFRTSRLQLSDLGFFREVRFQNIAR